MAKQVQIQIAPADYELLKAANYMMCFARKVNDTYDVVWQAYGEYLTTNSFAWPPNYQLFATLSFNAGSVVNVETNTVDIGLGQQATLDLAGVIGPVANGGPSDSITLVNNYGPVCPGLIGVATGPDGTQRQQPMFVEPDAIALGVDTLTPVDVVLVWFQQNIATGTMLSQDAMIAVSEGVEIDLTNEDKATRLYQNGIWSTIAPAP
jgi:hypothetical protein